MTTAAVTLSIVSPVHDEEESLPAFVHRTVAVMETVGESFELILVDDGSTDGSWSMIQQLHRTDPRVRGVMLSRNFGKESAMLAGLAEARADGAVVVMDSDLQHPPALLPALIDRWRDGAQVVETVKRARAGQTWAGRMQARAFNRTFNRLTGIDLTDATDYRLLDRSALDALLTLPERIHFFRATSTWIGFRRERITFDVDPRVAGRSRWSFLALLRMGLDGLTSFTAAPLQLVTLAAAAFAVFAAVLGAQTLTRFVQGEAVTGFTTVILVLLIQGTLILAGLGVIGQYLARIHDEVKARPRYLVGGRTPGGDQDRG